MHKATRWVTQIGTVPAKGRHDRPTSATTLKGGAMKKVFAIVLGVGALAAAIATVATKRAHHH
jgi:hypothetical protein